MARCARCNTVILFGGVREGGDRYCNAKCRQAGRMAAARDLVPAAVFEAHVQEVHQGTCPRCQGPGPVDVHLTHFVWSMVFATRWGTRPIVSCRTCARRRQLLAALESGVLGWWGFPFGLVITPVQIVRNFVEFGKGPDPSRPSARLEQAVGSMLGGRMAAGRLAPPTAPPTTPAPAAEPEFIDEAEPELSGHEEADPGAYEDEVNSAGESPSEDFWADPYGQDEQGDGGSLR